MSLMEFVRQARRQGPGAEPAAAGREAHEATERFAWGLVTAYAAVALCALAAAKALGAVASVMTSTHLSAAMQAGLSLY